MASRVKEDEKNERIIRGLLKLPENRRCINCNGLGPQYVCTNFWTFVCTNCSGIHREFTHRVKSVSMAKFNSQEVIALQGGGNKRARDIYLKEWDPQHHSAPDGSNADRLRDFIKHVYVDRRYTGERNCGKPSGLKLGDKEDLYQGGSRSPPYGDTYERRHSEMSSPGGRSDDRNSRYGYDERSPGYDQENRRYNGYETSPARAEMVNDWRREDRFGNGKRADDCRASDGDSKMERRSPERLKDPGASSPPIVRPVREILGDNVVPLRISEPPKTNSVRAANGSALTQRTASSSSLGSNYGNLTEVKVESAASLIDFDADPEQPITTAVPQAQQTIVSQSIAQPASATNDNNWASFDFAPEVKVSQASSNANPLESVLSQLSVPASVPGHISGMPSGTGAPVSVVNAVNLPSTTALPTAPAGNAHILPTCAIMFHPGGVSEAAPGLASVIPVNGGTSFVKVSETGQWRPSVQHQQPLLFPSSSGQSTQQFTLPFDGASTNQPWNLSVAPNVQAALSKTSVGPPQVISTPASGIASAGISQPPAMEVKSNGRKELPADLFAATYPSFPAAFPGWQTGPSRGMGFAMQYSNAAAPMPTFIQPSKSTNPFDLSEPSSVQGHTFPSMASLQGALPNMPPSSGLQHTSSLGAPSSAWTPSQSLPHPSALPSQPPSYAPAMPPRPYMGQVSSNMTLSGPQGVGGFGTEGGALGSINMDQQLAGRFTAPATSSPFSAVGGNPFG
ncbi:probable ADP-ribosylation factor GTPase-activating protein AGD14 isoform X3 [Manihot esculenta]|uniref:Uncharacterized protein n=1 Tax=Manihot esculenta TaxID=3983 RepID=A0ACB7HZ08_MANES|nr:probable ADP-ribosylation factor GTPase-activating protein AGD14 isoform X3 [Manihot esculenta]XP_043810790.1 probable ADP-ribosylation factor GTPase-activating protein AGD14 isoform X3 [Manihot esculenta]XP_043810791.1 probable ADP-ribosylation factor GTPase-activating protein AGD14 isoform X3 [Manihot esculenta]KAG8657406.1 hypothetical protein MANES_03G067000v8 [Manihot esculenta]